MEACSKLVFPSVQLDRKPSFKRQAQTFRPIVSENDTCEPDLKVLELKGSTVQFDQTLELNSKNMLV